MNVKVSADEIERAHPLGPKQIIVKFKSYKTKAVVYKAKSNLKGNGDGIFMTEDLTKRDHAIIEQLLLLKKSDKSHSFWTVDSKIFLKLSETSKPKQIRNKSEITASLTEGTGSASATGGTTATGVAMATATATAAPH